MIAIIAAYSIKNKVIGQKGQLPWNIPSDLANFKSLTTGHPIIMGKNTYLSIGRPLPNRTNIIVSSTLKSPSKDLIIFSNLKEAISYGESLSNKVFIIGGEALYKEAINLCDTLYLTEVEGEYEGDTYFPDYDKSQYKEVYRRTVHEEIAYDFIELKKL